MGLLRKVALATGLTTLTAVGLSRWAAAKRRRALELPSAFVLELDLESADLLEEQTGGLQKLLQQGKGQLPLAAAVKGLHKAADDPRVRGLLGVLGPLDGVGLAQVQELRDGVAAFRAGAAPRGAFAVAFAESYGEMPTVGTAPYYLATSFDRVYMAPVGTLSCTGLVLNVPFLKGLLDRLKIGVRRFQREEYKAALSPLAQTDFTAPEREMMEGMLADLADQVMEGIAAGRSLAPEAVRAAVDAAPYSSAEALARGLVDGALYRDQAVLMPARLHEAAARGAAREATAEGGARADGPAPPAAERGGATVGGGAKAAGGGAAAEGGACLDDHARLLADPDGQPATKLRRIPLSRYLRVLEAQERAAQGRGLWSGLREALREAGEDEGGDAPAAADGAGGRAELGAKAREGEEKKKEGKPVVAVFQLVGPIVLGPLDPFPGPGSLERRKQIASLPVTKALAAARAKPEVRAVVLRVDTGGGSATASDAIHREVELLRKAGECWGTAAGQGATGEEGDALGARREAMRGAAGVGAAERGDGRATPRSPLALAGAGKPVIVSMGAKAASGGYYIAAPASRILAQPSTLTGSIGVIGGKPLVGEALREFGINPVAIEQGKNVNQGSILKDFTPAQEANFNGLIDHMYNAFLARVAAGRGMAPDDVRAIAKGRVWTGRQALGLGLVDELGGFKDAVRLAKQHAGLPEEDEAAVDVKQVYPPRRSPLVQALKALRGGGGAPAAIAAAALVLAAAAGDVGGLGVAAVLERAGREALAAGGVDGSVQFRSPVAEMDIF
eukprot:scaffold3.g6371.t1